MRGKKIMDMALLVCHSGRGSVLFITVLCLILNILSSVSALSLSIPRNTNKFSTLVGSSPIYSNKLFGIPSTQHNLSQRVSAAANNDNISSNKSPKQWALVVRLSKISQQLVNLRKSIFKAAMLLSLVLFGFNKGVISTPPSAHAAWGSKSSNVVVVEAPPVVVKKASLVRKMTKLLVAAGAISVGLSVVPNTVGSSSSSTIDGEDDDRVVPKDEPSPLPLPTQNLELISKPKITSKTLYPPKQTNTKKDQSLVKDLDSKIEMLRIREENAKASAEKERLADLERAEAVRKQDQVEIEARIAVEAQKVKDAQRQKAILAERQREEELSKLENGKKFQKIKEQMSDDGGMVLEDVTAMIKSLPKKEISTAAPAVVRMGSSGPAKSKEEDIELTTQVILEHVKSKEGEEAGVVDDE